MAVLSHSLLAFLTIYIIYVACASYHPFVSWHAIFMVLSFHFLMSEAVMVFTPNSWVSRWLSRPGQVRLHWLLQCLCGILGLLGFTLIFANKWLNNFLHFHTWHAWIGLFGIIFLILNSLGGLATLNALKFKGWVTPARLKLAHNVFGIVTFVLLQLALLLGLYTNWFDKSASYTGKIISTFLLVMASIFTLEVPVQSAYARFQAFSQTNT